MNRRIRRSLSLALALLLLGVNEGAASAVPPMDPRPQQTYPSTWPADCPYYYGSIAQTQPSQPNSGMPITVDLHLSTCPQARPSDVFTLNFYFSDHAVAIAKVQFWPGTTPLSGIVPAGAIATCIAIGDNKRLDCWTVVFPGGLGRLGAPISTTDIRVNVPVPFGPSGPVDPNPNCEGCFP